MKPPAPQLAAAQLVEIGKPVYGGAFLARIEGKAVFVPLALPGEQATVRITENKPGYATAEIEALVTHAAERIAPPCPHFGICGGCHYQHTSYAQQLEFKQAILRETLERAGVQIPTSMGFLAGDPWHSRNRIRLAFDGGGNPGYRSRRSHEIVPISECPIAAPLLVAAAETVAELARAATPSFRPREIALFCDADESSLVASFFVANAAKIRFEELARSLQQKIPALVGAELVLESRAAKRGLAQPPRTIAQWGAPSLHYQAAGFDYRVDHGAFFQVNRWLVDELVNQVTAGHKGALAWDLFAGVGLFARKLTSSFTRVVAVESAPASTKALAANLKGTRAAPVRATTVDFLRRQSKGAQDKSAIPDLIVVDPPRTGLGTETCALLGEVAAPAIAYVSCDPATLARDLHALTRSGYNIQSITLADLFPQTFHIETIVQLRRA